MQQSCIIVQRFQHHRHHQETGKICQTCRTTVLFYVQLQGVRVRLTVTPLGGGAKEKIRTMRPKKQQCS
uniref:Uncharacterized protein n=1 Tax=Zea mays TaxID=4577 RepID=B7ZZF8_MAIZE|nr:unknown [Zea mays]